MQKAAEGRIDAQRPPNLGRSHLALIRTAPILLTRFNGRPLNTCHDVYCVTGRGQTAVWFDTYFTTAPGRVDAGGLKCALVHIALRPFIYYKTVSSVVS
eukprot:3377973-Pyramimonas_sp.AAC.1